MPNNISDNESSNDNIVGVDETAINSSTINESTKASLAVDFAALNLRPELISNLATLDYHKMTPIQAQSLPHILNNKDVMAQGKTGSGKTAAFGLGLLQNLDSSRFKVQSLVLCPTRELADQVANEIRKLARSIDNVKVVSLCGGVPLRTQVSSLEYGAHIIVGTPGRVEEHVCKETLHLDDLKTYVLDEADRMLEMGFQSSLDNITATMPLERQTLLFSATFTSQIESIARRIMDKPVIVKVESTHDEDTIAQIFYQVNDVSARVDAVSLLLLKHQPESALVFCNTKRESEEISRSLRSKKFSVLPMHGDLDQKDRDRTLTQFANKSISIIVATDVAARGIDVAAIDLVINYQLPRDLEVYTHRIGRTGRAGVKGLACTLYNQKEEYKVNKLEAYLNQKLSKKPLPSNDVLSRLPHKPAMATMQIDGGKKDKVRAGDILGALTGGKDGEQRVNSAQVGKIQILNNKSYVAISRPSMKLALKKLSQGKIKGRTFKVRHL